ncbi:MAG: hypothetical protein R3B72_33550 [Polyangiaceae bacterium]
MSIPFGCGDGSNNVSEGGGGATASGGSGGAGASASGGSGGFGAGMVDPTCVDGVTTALPSLPELQGVRARVRGSRLQVTFEPVAQARDYRVYVLPEDGAIDASGGKLHVENAIYRCAGDRMAPYVELNGQGPSGWVSTWTEGDVVFYSRSDADKTLGYVYVEDGPNRTPIYSVGSPDPDADGQCYEERWGATRVVEYVDAATRATRLAAGWRDDGIAFYLPDDGDRQVHMARDGETRLFFADAAELAARDGAEPVFSVASSAADGMVPLLRVYYDVGCGTGHDVLAAGEGRFERITTQGNQPVWELTWPSLKEGDVLVVEALDQGCPWQGHLANDDLPGVGNAQDFVSPETVQATAPYGELFINGQHDPANEPSPMARSFVCVDPAPDEDTWDFMATFDEPLEALQEVGLETFGGWNLHLENASYNVDFYSIEPEMWSLGTRYGELWVAYADWASDTNGKARVTPKTRATLAADSFVHASMEVDIWSTGRRYPQLWLSDHPAPVQDSMDQGVTLNVQTIQGWPTSLQIQLCDHQSWDVNAQCPHFTIEKEAFSDQPWPPHDTVAEHAGVAKMARLDVYASTSRAYLFLDGQPYGCADLPSNTFSPGEIAVTAGDVLYHSGVDEPVVGSDYYPFHQSYMLTETRRHFDHLAFVSGVEAPTWDESRVPCVATLDP